MRNFFLSRLIFRSSILTGLLLLGFISIITSAFRASSNTNTEIRYWQVDGVDREAMVYVPESAATTPTPVIFAFHGHGGTMANIFNTLGFDKLWPEAIIICPQGLNTPGQLTDQGGNLPGWQKTPGDMSDRDLHFFDAMLKTLRQDYKIDDKRIYATGHSNGGGFTYLLWATRGDVFAAVAPSSAVAPKVVNMLQPKPAMHIMGETDPLVKPEWQRAMCDRVLKINSCNTEGKDYGTYAKLYPSSTGNPTVLYVHPGGHVYPKEADEAVVKFFKSVVKK
jgi:polyhydroxybutyrate depolymerase